MNNLTFVIRGSYSGYHPAYRDSNTFRLIRSIEEYFPESFIILTEWTSYKDLYYIKKQHARIKIVICKDPGAPSIIGVGPDFAKYKNNINRQIIMAKSALNHSNTEYTCLVRSDFRFHNTNILKLYPHFKKHSRENKYLIFKQPILIPFFGSVFPKKRIIPHARFQFHPSDFFHFGLTKDIKEFWNLPLMSVDEHMWYLHNPRGKEKMLDNYDSGYLCKYLPEQYLFVKNLKRKKILSQLDFNHMEDKPNYYSKLSDKLIRNSFFMATFREIGCSPQNDRVIFMKLPRTIFKRRTIVLATLNDLFARYSITERKINIFSKTILLTKNLIIYICELIIGILYGLSKNLGKSKLKKKVKTIKKVI